MALAAGIAAAGSALTVRYGWLDSPGVRSSHVRPTRTGGGVAILLAVLAATSLLDALGLRVRASDAAGVLTAASLMGLIGGLDDRRSLDARFKLLAGALVAIVAVLMLPVPRALSIAPRVEVALPWAVGCLGAVLWLVTVTNAVNFMDGANGLVPGGLPIAFTALSLAAGLRGDAVTAAMCALAAAAYIGFLPWNLAGRLFQGDAGSLFGGFLFAGLHLASAGRGAVPLLFGPTLLLPWLTDVLLTLLRRARARRPLLSAHREHLYQRWLQATGRSHLALAARNAAVCGAAAAVAMGMWAAPWNWQGPIFAIATLAAVAAWTLASRRFDGRLDASGRA